MDVLPPNCLFLLEARPNRQPCQLKCRRSSCLCVNVAQSATVALHRAGSLPLRPPPRAPPPLPPRVVSRAHPERATPLQAKEALDEAVLAYKEAESPLADCQHELDALEFAEAELRRLVAVACANRNLQEQRAELREQADAKQAELAEKAQEKADTVESLGELEAAVAEQHAAFGEQAATTETEVGRRPLPRCICHIAARAARTSRARRGSYRQARRRRRLGARA